MPYALIPLIAAVVLAVHHLVISEASRRSKWTVAFVVVTSLAIWRFFPRWTIVALLLQAVVSIYMLMHLNLRRAGL
jgi:hypothetical protein